MRKNALASMEPMMFFYCFTMVWLILARQGNVIILDVGLKMVFLEFQEQFMEFCHNFKFTMVEVYFDLRMNFFLFKMMT